MMIIRCVKTFVDTNNIINSDMREYLKHNHEYIV